MSDRSVDERSVLVHRVAAELDKPSIYMGGPSRASVRKAEAVVNIVWDWATAKSRTHHGETT